jgi:hypothetical protein
MYHMIGLGNTKVLLSSLKKLSTEPLLIYPDFKQPFIVACDASTKAIGAVLSQLREGEERPVAYCSRQLNCAESKHSVTELELLAFLFAVKQFRCYLYGRKFVVQEACMRYSRKQFYLRKLFGVNKRRMSYVTDIGGTRISGPITMEYCIVRDLRSNHVL